MKDTYREYIEADKAITEEKRRRLDASTDKNKRWRSFWLSLRECGLVRFFVVRWRAFKDAHPKGAELIAQFANFLLFSCSVTVWQYLVMLFLPYAFESLAAVPFVWPEVTLWHWGDGSEAVFGLFNEPVLYDSLGNVKIGGGLGNFLAFEIAVFTAQCINFPLQRNITFKSHGNPWWQAMWYFIGWVLVSLFTSALWGFINIFCIHLNLPNALTVFLKTNVVSTISMVVFFFVFKIIFKDSEAKKV